MASFSIAHVEGTHHRAAMCRALVSVGVLAALLALWPLRIRAQTHASELQVKAAFLFHFAQLVEWPPDSLGAHDVAMNFCVLGEEPMQAALVALTQGKQIGTHPIHVRRLGDKEDSRGCHLLFIGGQDSQRANGIPTVVKEAPILTVGESKDFLLQGGVIALCLQENKIRFDINLKAAQHANLKISSRLLLLARSVIGEQ